MPGNLLWKRKEKAMYNFKRMKRVKKLEVDIWHILLQKGRRIYEKRRCIGIFESNWILRGILWAIIMDLYLLLQAESSLLFPQLCLLIFLNGRRNVTQLREDPWCKYRGFFIFQLKFHSINRHKYLQKKGGIN